MLNPDKKSFLESEVYVNFQNSTAEIFLAYLFGILSLILTYFTTNPDLTKVDAFNEVKPTVSTALIAIFPLFILITLLTFFGEKINKKILPYHSDRLLMNVIQVLGIPAILAAWFFYIYYIIAENYKKILAEGIIISLGSILNYLLLLYLIFFSIKFFSSVSVSKKSDNEAKQVAMNPIILVASIAIALITFYKNISNPGLAYAQSFLTASFIFRTMSYLYAKTTSLNILKTKNENGKK
jgi:hypothetical protein